MSEIHYGATVPACNPRYSAVVPLTQDWAKVTCGACKLERPLEPVQPEYRVPANVLATDAFFVDPSLAEIRARRLHYVRASEEFARATMKYWTKVWSEAASLLQKLENESGQGQGTPKINNAQDDVEAFWRMFTAGTGSVDISTDSGHTEGMTNTEQLSEQAKTALMNAQPHQGAPVSASALWLKAELTDAGLIGPEGGLTRAGTIARQKLVQAAEDAAFS